MWFTYSHFLGLNRTEYGCLCGFPVWKVKVAQFDSGECELLYFLSKLGQFVNLFAFYFISFANFVSITRYTRLIHVFSMYIVYM